MWKLNHCSYISPNIVIFQRQSNWWRWYLVPWRSCCICNILSWSCNKILAVYMFIVEPRDPLSTSWQQWGFSKQRNWSVAWRSTWPGIKWGCPRKYNCGFDAQCFWFKGVWSCCQAVGWPRKQRVDRFGDQEHMACIRYFTFMLTKDIYCAGKQNDTFWSL